MMQTYCVKVKEEILTKSTLLEYLIFRSHPSYFIYVELKIVRGCEYSLIVDPEHSDAKNVSD